MSLSKKETFEQRPNEAVRASKPCGYLRCQAEGWARAASLRPQRGEQMSGGATWGFMTLLYTNENLGGP